MTVTTDGAASQSTYSAVSTSGALTHAVGGANQSNALLIATVAYTTTTTTPQPISGITDSQGNTWQKLTSFEAHAGWTTGQTVNGQQRSFAVEVWYAKAATVNASINITINHSGTIDAAVASFSSKYLGYNATNPFDTNASLPKILQSSGLTAESLTGISTTTTNVYPVWCFGIWGTSLGVSNVSFNGVFHNDQVAVQKNASEFVKGQFASGPAAVGPYVNVTYSAPTSDYNWIAIGVALTADAAGPVAPTIARATIVG